MASDNACLGFFYESTSGLSRQTCPHQSCHCSVTGSPQGPEGSHMVCVTLVGVVQSLSDIQHFAPPWTAACQASLTISWSLPKFTSIESVMPSNHLNLRHPLLLLPSIFPSIRDFSNESVLSMWWPKYWSFSISPSNEYSNLISFWIERENYFYILLTFITCVFSFVSFLITSFAVFHFAFVFSYFIIAFYFYERNYCLFF